MNGKQWTRRDFARHAGSCAAHLALAATAAPLALRRLWAAQTTGSVLAPRTVPPAGTGCRRDLGPDLPAAQRGPYPPS